MPYANINTTITAADLALLLGYFVSIESKTTFAVNLSKKENNEVFKLLGKRSSEFLLRVQKIADNNPNPMKEKLTTAELTRLIDQFNQQKQLLPDLNDITLQQGSATLQLYNTFRQRLEGMKDLPVYDEKFYYCGTK